MTRQQVRPDARFELGATLGRGSSAVVYRARSSHGDLAIKVLHPALARSALARRRLAAEAQVLKALPPSHGPALVEGHADAEQPFLAMERVTGESLRSRLDRVGSLSATEAVTLIAAACQALQAVHDAGFAHLDIKPAHLFVASGRVRLIDFGSACGQRRTQTTASSGTPSYMSPERIARALEAPIVADVWSLGAVAFECLAGCRPFSGATRSQLIAQVLRGHIPRIGEVVPHLSGTPVERCIQRALSRQPERRFRDCATMRTDFLAAIGQSPRAARGTHEGTQSQATARRMCS
jgi:eukaryotic-like serine/threonine-protein kinase